MEIFKNSGALNIGLAAWMIQDGNYSDFEVGQVAEFAVEFWVPDGGLVKSSNEPVSAKSVGDNIYDAVAEIVVSNHRIEVLDIGVLVYRHMSADQPSLQQDSSRIALELRLCVDAYSCFEAFDRRGEIVPLVSSWKILSILKQTAAFISAGDEARSVPMGNPNRLGYEAIAKTDAWHDDAGHGSYLLHCEHLPIPPKRTSGTALR